MEENNQCDINNRGKASPDPTRVDHYSPSALALLWRPAAPQHFASAMRSCVMTGQEGGEDVEEVGCRWRSEKDQKS